ncbi:hypothetical protein [Gordonia shandongensis]|uniref:hypothetical protein n=1 Tax=Gordonia shandongensis TaxID=376351 RepID=UPI000411EC9F|nr:hypothetical protein [Gordonia shandongensis]
MDVLLDLLTKAWPPAVAFVLGAVGGLKWPRIWRRVRGHSDVQVHVEQDPQIIHANAPDWVSFPQFVARRREALPPAPAGKATEMPKWAAKLDGYAAHNMDLLVTITAWEDRGVVVSALRVDAKACNLPEGYVLTRPVGGASMEFKRMEVTLSSWATNVLSKVPGGEIVEPFAFQLDRGESAQFHLIVHANGDESKVAAYEWTATLDLVVGGRHREVRIDNNGKPFILVNREQRPELWWVNNEWTDQSTI